MTKAFYHITVISPLGPRAGTLLLIRSDDGSFCALIKLLGYVNLFTGAAPSANRYQGNGTLTTAVSDLDCYFDVQIHDEDLEGSIATSKGQLLIKGVLKYEQEK